jgi:hypothetical protein
MIDAEEQGPVQQLVTDPAVECLAIAVLNRPAGGMECHLTCIRFPVRQPMRPALFSSLFVAGKTYLGPVSSNHRKALAAVFTDPVSQNFHWTDVIISDIREVWNIYQQARPLPPWATPTVWRCSA